MNDYKQFRELTDELMKVIRSEAIGFKDWLDTQSIQVKSTGATNEELFDMYISDTATLFYLKSIGNLQFANCDNKPSKNS